MISEGESQALESLSHFQMQVLFGQMHQVRVLDCLQSGMEDFDSDGESEDEEAGYDGESYDESDDKFIVESDYEFCDEPDNETDKGKGMRFDTQG